MAETEPQALTSAHGAFGSRKWLLTCLWMRSPPNKLKCVCVRARMRRRPLSMADGNRRTTCVVARPEKVRGQG